MAQAAAGRAEARAAQNASARMAAGKMVGARSLRPNKWAMPALAGTPVAAENAANKHGQHN